MSFSTKAHVFFGINIDLPESVEWSMLDGDTKDGIKMIHYGSDGDSMYAAAIAASVTTVDLDASADTVITESNVDWPMRLRAFCQRHKLTYTPAAWRLAVERF